jgi:CRP-like cAMP-binding protein
MNPLDVLARHPLFALAPAAVADAWLAAGLTARFATGETVFREGSPGESACVVLRGRVRILRRVSSGRELTLGDLTPGELFGEHALLPPHNNAATCRTVEDSIVAQFPLSAVRDWLTRSPAVSSRLKNWLQLHFLLRQLRGQSPFGFMSATSAMAMLPHLAQLDVAEGCAVQADGLCDDRWLFVERGEVLVEAGGGRSRVAGPGANLGEAALFGGGSASFATITALTPVRCMTLSRDDFFHPDRPPAPPAATAVRTQA